MPKLISSAIKFKPKNCEYFQIACGKRHYDILEMIYNLYGDYEKTTVVQGFLTDEDQFVDRYDAYYIALMNHQVKANDEFYRTPLYSEDIWPE